MRSRVFKNLMLPLAVAFAGCAIDGCATSQPNPGVAARTPRDATPDAGLPESGAGPLGTAQTAEPADPAPALPTTCSVITPPPRELASKPGYSQYDVVVRSPAGNPVAKLKRSDFAATALGKAVPIVFFEDVNNSPISIVILIDTSGSMHPKLPWVRSAVDQFVKELQPQDQVALIGFSSRGVLLQPLTSDHKQIESKLHLLHAYGRTATFDSELMALKVLEKAANPRRALLVITDGIDNESVSTAVTVEQQIKQSGSAFFAIGIGDPKAPASFTIGTFSIGNLSAPQRVDEAALRSLAGASGGKVWIVRTDTNSTAVDFATAMMDVAQSLGRLYAIGVVLPAPMRPDTTVQIGITDHPDTIATACLAVAPTSPVVAEAGK